MKHGKYDCKLCNIEFVNCQSLKKHQESENHLNTEKRKLQVEDQKQKLFRHGQRSIVGRIISVPKKYDLPKSTIEWGPSSLIARKVLKSSAASCQDKYQINSKVIEQLPEFIPVVKVPCFDGGIYLKPNNLLQHQSSFHSKNGNRVDPIKIYWALFTCDICGFESIGKFAMTVHMQTTHCSTAI